MARAKKVKEASKRSIQTLPEGYGDDPLVSELFNEIENTNKSFFITGRAGTGKSTFIHYLAQNSKKNILILAFTGIAAINVKGQTIHSVFQFPFKPLLPNDHEIKIFRRNSNKRRILDKADIILIDEVSMLRSDILEAMDFSLRKNGGDAGRPFGGKQMIFVGDIFQLPPVANEGDPVVRHVFNEVYDSPYFFDSHAYQKLKPIHFEFTTVHRQQSDHAFVELLDKVRLGKVDGETLEKLNRRHIKEEEDNEFRVHLTTTNAIADAENMKELARLDTKLEHFTAMVDGSFDSKRYPAPPVLALKKNAQVIILKNDPNGKYANGTIAKVVDIQDERVEVEMESGKRVKLDREVWENVRFNYDRTQEQIIMEAVGTFTQFPIKLAWAITIHKSQGLTFDKVIIDLGQGAFANGQAYTALSRCRTLDGITLKKPIRADDIMIDERLIRFNRSL